MQKQLKDIRIKSDLRGEVEAVFSTLNVIDSDGDVTLPGAFRNGAEAVISAYGHQSWQGMLPVGKGTIRETGDEAILDGRFFLETAHGRDTFHVVRELGSLQEWSYSLENVISKPGKMNGRSVNFLHKIDVKEVSPVLRGAGVGTRTLVAKSAGIDARAQAELKRIRDSICGDHLARDLALEKAKFERSATMAALSEERHRFHAHMMQWYAERDAPQSMHSFVWSVATRACRDLDAGLPKNIRLMTPASDAERAYADEYDGDWPGTCYPGDADGIYEWNTGVVWIRSDRSRARIAYVVAHECRHHAGSKIEDDCNQFAASFVKRHGLE